MLAQFISITIQLEEGSENTALEAASKLAMDDHEAAEMEFMEKKSESSPSSVVVRENAPGSYEQLMGSSLARGKMEEFNKSLEE